MEFIGKRVYINELSIYLNTMLHKFVEKDGFIISSVNFVEEKIKDKQYKISVMKEDVDENIFLSLYEIFSSDSELRIVELN